MKGGDPNAAQDDKEQQGSEAGSHPQGTDKDPCHGRAQSGEELVSEAVCQISIKGLNEGAGKDQGPPHNPRLRQ